jgi:hypothetical protein
MKRSLLIFGVLVAAAGGLAGCHVVDGSAFEGSTPTSETVALVVPGGGTATATGALTDTGVRRSALLGEKADSYKFTVAISDLVNGATVAVLTLVHTVVEYPPTTVDGDTAVWGPYSEPLKANAWRLTVTRVEKHVFNWALDGKPKTADDSAFVTVLSGTHTRAVDQLNRAIRGFGSGNFSVDWNAAATLPDNDGNTGTATFTYSRLAPGAAVAVDVGFHGIKDDKTGEIFDAVYHYASTPGAGGDLKYGANQDYYPGPGPTGTAKEALALHSRWLETGAGRTDIQVSGGDLTASAGTQTASECWDTGFASVYKVVTYDTTQDWGAESSCAFATADFVTLSP